MIEAEYIEYIKHRNPYNVRNPIREAEELELRWEQSDWARMKNIDVSDSYTHFLNEKQIGFNPQRTEPIIKDIIFRKKDKQTLKSIQEKLDL